MLTHASRFLAALSLALTTTVLAQPAERGAIPKEPTISVNGTARVERTPDYVDVSFGIIAHDKTASEAQAAASKTMEAALKAIRDLKLPGEDLQTGSVDLAPLYDNRPEYANPSNQPNIVGYRAEITVRVRTSDLKSVPKIIDAALAAGCNRVDYVSFGIKEALEAREEAIRLAAQAATRKAKVLAEALDLRIERVVTAGTSSQMGGWYGGNRYMANSMAQRASMESGPAQEDQSPVVPGKVEIWADANITFVAVPTNQAQPQRP